MSTRNRFLLTAIVLVSILIGSAPLLAAHPKSALLAESKGRVFTKSGDTQTPLFLYERKVKSDGAKILVDARYTDPKGTLVVQEKMKYENGSFSSVEFYQNQDHQSGKAWREGKKIKYEYTDTSGEKRTNEEDWKENTIVSDQVEDFLVYHWKEIQDDKEIKVRLIVVDRLETFGFTFKKEKTIQYDRKKAVVVKMFATSFIIGVLMGDPITFTFIDEGNRPWMVEHIGLALPKIKNDDEWTEFDSRSIYSETL